MWLRLGGTEDFGAAEIIERRFGESAQIFGSHRPLSQDGDESPGSVQHFFAPDLF